MRTAKALIVGVLLAVSIPVITAPMTGCSLIQNTATPERIYFESQEAFIVLVTAAIEAKRKGTISQDDWDSSWNPAIQQGSDLLDEMQAAYLEGDYESFNLARSTLTAVAEILKGGE